MPENQTNHRLPKGERLSSISEISAMLAKAKYGRVEGLRYSFATGNGKEYNRLLVSVGKRFFKRAVKRNLLKRRIREAYRLQKDLLQVKGVDIQIIYNTKEVLDSDVIAKAVAQTLLEIEKRING